MRVIPYARQDISPEDVDAVVAVLRSDWLTQGPAVERFEHDVAQWVGAAHAVAVSSGTAGLHLACCALDVGPGDSVWTSANTFVASANCALYCGAKVDFVDIDSRTYNLSVEALAHKLESAARTRRLPKVVIPVHFAGQPCDMAAIATLAARYGFRVVEDATHAVGAHYAEGPVGSCGYSDITVFSFHPVKIITTGEGGMVLCRNPELAARVRLLRTHGITRQTEDMSGEPEGAWYYEQVALGFNYRMSDIQAALGASQLTRLEEFIRRRAALAGAYRGLLGDLALVLPWQDPRVRSAWHLYPVKIDSARTASTRKDVFRRLRDAGIRVNVHYIPVHLHPYFRRLGFRPGDFPHAEEYYRQAITLPLYYGLRDEDQQCVAAALREAMS